MLLWLTLNRCLLQRSNINKVSITKLILTNIDKVKVMLQISREYEGTSMWISHNDLLGIIQSIQSNLKHHLLVLHCKYVGNKTKGQISKRSNKKAKHAKFSEKRTFLTLWYSQVCALIRWVRNIHFSENLVCFVFL